MEHYARIDVSLESSSVCVVDATGRIIERRQATQRPIGTATVVLHDDDGVVPAHTSEEHATHFTGGHQRRVLRGIGHNVPQEAPDATVAAIRKLAR